MQQILPPSDPARLLLRINHEAVAELEGQKVRIHTSRQLPDHARRVAVVGSGISGLSAAWLLSSKLSVTLYESETRLGGHSNTVIVPTKDGALPVDTGFIVYNERNYPNLVALFKQIGVPTAASDMSFAASLDGGKLEYSGSGLNGLIGQRGNVVRPRFWRMMRDILRFYREAPALLLRTDLNGVSLGEYLDLNAYAPAFIEDHLLPMGAAIWSTTAREMRAYPLLAFVRFFASHGLLSLADRPKWRTVLGGSCEYVHRLSASFTKGIRLGVAVRSISRENDRVVVTDAAGHVDTFTDVVIATHADQALGLLADADQAEQGLLGAFRYTDNLAVLHSDETLMPRRRRVWSSWNYIGESRDDDAQPLCVTYWMNRLQNLDRRYPLFVTLNPTREIAPSKIIGSYNYTHPLFDQRALDAQQRLWCLQGRRNTWFCGAYFGFGFHEDGLQAGLAAAESVTDVQRPWRVRDESGRLVIRPRVEAAE
ncbi:putative NAD/FAD-binding protein [Aminobacter aminovorans]|uniref:Protoporphyrinogen oxidase n=1 Tax=Aminobacter aminovorans TaxID=83263 RepID=A0A381IKM5_AMIAI|nr:putative NAD/FAD-binding protein [Aminobacter aminovorans]SUY28653.1 protoporphyrinogen oxidase [Aminobacter aminovorans]